MCNYVQLILQESITSQIIIQVDVFLIVQLILWLTQIKSPEGVYLNVLKLESMVSEHMLMIQQKNVSKNVPINHGLTPKIPHELVFLDAHQTLMDKIIHVNVLLIVLFGRHLQMTQLLFVWVNAQLILLQTIFQWNVSNNVLLDHMQIIQLGDV